MLLSAPSLTSVLSEMRIFFIGLDFLPVVWRWGGGNPFSKCKLNPGGVLLDDLALSSLDRVFFLVTSLMSNAF